MTLLLNLIYIFSIAIFMNCAKSSYEQCGGLPGEKYEDLEKRINVSSCGPSRCILLKGTNTTVSLRFKPEKRVTSLINYVSEILHGIPIPLTGVTGSSACADVRRADTGEAAPCPLEPGLEYVYNNSFYIYPKYPKRNLLLHWALFADEDTVICFEVPAKIVSNPNLNKNI